MGGRRTPAVSIPDSEEFGPPGVCVFPAARSGNQSAQNRSRMRFLVIFHAAVLAVFSLATTKAPAQTPPTGIKVKVVADPIGEVDFGQRLRRWDGFGVNYVETAQTRDYDVWKQEFGGFSLLSESEREEILELIFGADGLKPGLTKMFLDPWHEGKTRADNDNGDPWTLNLEGYDHERTTEWMRYFNREGLQRMREWGGDLTILTTLYGPPPWMTRQLFLLGRDIDPELKLEVAEYMVSWVKFLREKEGLPVRYLSFHNEGDAYYRWPRDGSNPGEDHRDYNALWRPDLVVDFLKLARRMLDHNGLKDVGLTPGETQTWSRFDEWGYAQAIAQDAEALEHLSLITGHSFAAWHIPKSVYYGDWRSTGIDLLRERKGGELHAWVTSMSWGDMDAQFIDNIRRNIYISKVNGLIPWAVTKRPSQWIGGDPNPDGAFEISEDGGYRILPGYYFYRLVSRAGQPGMAVAAVRSYDPALGLIAFASNGTRNPDAFVVINVSEVSKETRITVKGSQAREYNAFRSSASERYESLGLTRLAEGELSYTAPAGSVTAFHAR